jgi:hypothetical protein
MRLWCLWGGISAAGRAGEQGDGGLVGYGVRDRSGRRALSTRLSARGCLLRHPRGSSIRHVAGTGHAALGIGWCLASRRKPDGWVKPRGAMFRLWT